jgi:hypothetical protein
MPRLRSVWPTLIQLALSPTEIKSIAWVRWESRTMAFGLCALASPGDGVHERDSHRLLSSSVARDERLWASRTPRWRSPT